MTTLMVWVADSPSAVFLATLRDGTTDVFAPIGARRVLGSIGAIEKGRRFVAQPQQAQPAESGNRSVSARLLASEQIRFILVGVFNTGFGFALFVALELMLTGDRSYFISLCASYAISTLTAFVLHRHFTYRKSGTGNMLVDFVRFEGVYLVSLGVNAVVLPLLVEGAHIPPIPAQAIAVCITTAISYFGHKFFSFRRPTIAPPLR